MAVDERDARPPGSTRSSSRSRRRSRAAGRSGPRRGRSCSRSPSSSGSGSSSSGSEWKPENAFASPSSTFSALFDNWSVISEAMWTTLRRGVQGYAIAIVDRRRHRRRGGAHPVLRAAIGSMITGLQTMPSVAWYPLALLLFKLSEGAIFFVIVLGAAPSIANGLINGVDNISPVLLRAGKVLGAKRLDSFRYVILPAALPSFVGGLKQGWAFAWRSLLAGEIIGGIAGYSLGQQLANPRHRRRRRRAGGDDRVLHDRRARRRAGVQQPGAEDPPALRPRRRRRDVAVLPSHLDRLHR